MRFPVLLIDPQATDIKHILAQSAPDIEFIEDIGDVESVRQCEIWFGAPDKAAALLVNGFKPRWFQSTWAGIRPLLSDRLPTDYRLSRAVGIFGQPIAEYVLARLLEHSQQLRARALSQAHQEWNASLPGVLSGSKVLIVGAGEIGQSVAGYLRPFGVRLTGVATLARPVPNFDAVVTLADLCTVATDADYVVNILPDTTATTDIFDDAFFAALKPGAIFINVGRGSAVVDRALISALEQGRLAAAVLDVFREEPLPVAHPFWTTPRLTLTGHIAGPTIPSLICGLFVENLRRFNAGDALKGEVDFLRPY
ncbi:hydroxyacid dehydrogenase [Parazoarcus communis]|uniref:Hydroxyacid dehydrogenase n=2 Tax=Parazoarcus communis TaxID=41977 RepID=A0A2U8H703_9RHOO|nr:hydroxyacid dehydrogenase [Parazoarcus communis]